MKKSTYSTSAYGKMRDRIAEKKDKDKSRKNRVFYKTIVAFS